MRVARRKLGAAALPWLAPPTVRWLARSWRMQRLGLEHLAEARSHPAAILVLWHGGMLLPMVEWIDTGAVVLVSPSDDGELADTLLRHLGYRTLRGSSNKRPAAALRELVTELERGSSIVLTPDGPRGPRHSMNPGPAWLARETGLPALAIGTACDRSWNLSSWDRFAIPKPRARVALAYAPPLFVPRDADEEALERASAELASRLNGADELGRASLANDAPEERP